MATKAELEKQLEEKQKIIDEHKARIKAQNESAKERWETVSCRLPKGTKARISALGLTINGVINESVLAYLDCMEEAEAEENDQDDDISNGMGGTGKSADNGITLLTEPQNAPETATTDAEVYPIPEERDRWLNVQSAEELQAMLETRREEEKRRLQEQKQAKIDEPEQERAENLRVMIDAIESARQAQAERTDNPANEVEDKDPEAPITEAGYKPMVYLDANNNVIDDPQQYLLDLQRQKAEEWEAIIKRNQEYEEQKKLPFWERKQIN